MVRVEKHIFMVMKPQQISRGRQAATFLTFWDSPGSLILHQFATSGEWDLILKIARVYCKYFIGTVLKVILKLFGAECELRYQFTFISSFLMVFT